MHVPVPITVFESERFLAQCLTLITADQCSTLKYVPSLTVALQFFSAIPQGYWGSVPVSLGPDKNALSKPHKVSTLVAPDVI